MDQGVILISWFKQFRSGIDSPQNPVNLLAIISSTNQRRKLHGQQLAVPLFFILRRPRAMPTQAFARIISMQKRFEGPDILTFV